MQMKDKKWLATIYNRVSVSVTKVNEKIVAHRDGKATVESLQTAVALEQLAMQHEILLILGVMLMDPALAAEPLPEIPKKIIGFN
jgi:hypothetical protein